MKPNVNSLERAFELARTGAFESVDDIKGQLHREGYSFESVVGKHLSAQLRELIRLAHPEPYEFTGEAPKAFRGRLISK
jgi:hypothetical protein